MSGGPVIVLPRDQAEAWVPQSGEVAISIGNPRQSAAALDPGFAEVLALGFHDTDKEGGGFTPMSPQQAREVMAFGRRHAGAALMVHCQAGASRSVAVGLILAAWHRRPLQVLATDVLIPNPWVINQLRAAALGAGWRARDPRLLRCAVFGSPAWLTGQCASVALGRVTNRPSPPATLSA